jgi:hypothetical protein
MLPEETTATRVATASACGHCHDDPPWGHTCPACGLRSRRPMSVQTFRWLSKLGELKPPAGPPPLPGRGPEG